MKYKVCPNCGKKKLLNKKNFSPSKSKSSGFLSWCKVCYAKATMSRYWSNPIKFRKMSRDYRRKNKDNPEFKEKKRKQDAKYYLDNRDRIIRRTLKWQKKNPSKANAKARRWNDRNPEKVKAKSKKWASNHPDDVKRIGHNYRARRFGVRGQLKHIDFKALLKKQKNKCYYCGVKIKWPDPKTNIEHKIPLSRGGSNYLRNIVLACEHCNAKKHDLTSKEYMARMERAQ